MTTPTAASRRREASAAKSTPAPPVPTPKSATVSATSEPRVGADHLPDSHVPITPTEADSDDHHPLEKDDIPDIPSDGDSDSALKTPRGVEKFETPVVQDETHLAFPSMVDEEEAEKDALAVVVMPEED